MSTIFNKRVDISPPSVELLDLIHGEGTETLPEDDKLVKVSFRLKIGTLVDSYIMQLLPLDFAKSLVNELLNPTPAPQEMTEMMQNEAVQTAEPEQIQHQQVQIEDNQQQLGFNQDRVHQSSPITQTSDPIQPFYSENKVNQPTEPQHFGSSFQQGTVTNVQPAVFSNFEPIQLQQSEAKNLEMLLDIPLQVTVQLGKTKRTVKEILELSSGSIIELDKLAGEPVDIHINDRLIAQGEVVVIDENFGVRVTDIISQSDRLRKLK